MGTMKNLYLDIKETSEQVIKKIEERSSEMFPCSIISSCSGKPQAWNSYMYLLLEGVGTELIRASAKYKEMIEDDEEE